MTTTPVVNIDIPRLLFAAQPDEPGIPQSLAGFCAELADQLVTKARDKATQKRKGHVEYGKHIGTAVVELNAVADALRKHAQAAQPAEPIDCPAVSVGIGAKCMRTDPGHVNHTFPPTEPKTPDQTPTESALGDGPACGATDPYVNSPTLDPDVCTAPAGHQGNHIGTWSRWPHQDAVIAFLTGKSDDISVVEPTFGDVADSTPVEVPVQPISGGWAAISAVDEPTFRPAPDPAPFAPPPARPELFDHTSVSQIAMGEACGLQLRLIKRDGVDQQPAWWNIGGSAFHACAEMIERYRLGDEFEILAHVLNGEMDACTELFAVHLSREIEKTEAGTKHDRSLWRAAQKGTEGEEWWREHGPEMVRSYAAWSAQRHADGWAILTLPQIGPALEMPVSTPFVAMTGPCRIDGRIDQAWIRVSADGSVEIEIVDPKSGYKGPPKSTFQLGSYGHGLAADIQERLGKVAGQDYTLTARYYDARNGKLADAIDPLAVHSAQEIAYRAANVANMHVTGVYPANPNPEFGGPCGICDVRHACPIMAMKS